MKTRTAKLGIEAVPPRGAGPATSQTAIGGWDVVAASGCTSRPLGVGLRFSSPRADVGA